MTDRDREHEAERDETEPQIKVTDRRLFTAAMWKPR